MQVTEILLLDSPSSAYVLPIDCKRGTRVVVSTQTGLELGIVKTGVEIDNPELSTFVRIATEEDSKKREDNNKYTHSILPEIKKEAQRLNLNMKIGIIATTLDRSKIIVNYTADERVDFRELIKVLGSNYKTRIEMRQIGNRDETKCLGAIGMCGQVCCCKRFLNDFDKVTIKMAKNQNISLNPTRINGMCGRLLCCLKYEDDFYEEMQKRMPKIGFKVSTPDGKGEVAATNFLQETVTVKFVDGESVELKTYSLEDIKTNKDAKAK